VSSWKGAFLEGCLLDGFEVGLAYRLEEARELSPYAVRPVDTLKEENL
jgi:hypothetical protein